MYCIGVGMKKTVFLIIVLLGIGVPALLASVKRKEQGTEVFNINARTEAEIKDELIVAMFIQDIEEAVKEYYEYHLSRNVTVYDYETVILDIKKTDGGLILIKFGVTPQEGAHNPAGNDELTYSIDSGGRKQRTDYRHVK